ncbi:M24 family metallopeptidase [Alkalihalobacillus hemicellulosilyticus]|uniref:Aminopeptidase YpdF n=1 Tax=Halalkalibacter hemicellulosilyticusJCM 9152 TaxID=1236971 RepID=W4QJR2_9BACI|nr:Xaa-Pro peptidase family protein [Halalkalibacter hemicellulosilyticus]GAE31863.1 aminopeptidase YpdF [Halalkalibacter hemicellulosilyticusJCM 9152]
MSRLEALREQFSEHNIDALLITSSYNRRYMANFTGTAGVALITNRDAIFVTDFRYMEQAKEQAKGFEIVEHTGPIFAEVTQQCQKYKVKKLGFEQAHVTYEYYQLYQQALVDTELVPVSGLVEELRLIKDAAEIQKVQAAATIADAAFDHIVSYIRPGLKEIEVANELEFFMRKEGATSSSFDMIVASGYRSALPHGVASEKVIESGELVTLDFGALLNGYCSDMTRTVAVGTINDQLKEIYDTVLQAQLKGMEGIKPGLTGKEADALTRDYIEKKGYGAYFGHSTGHGLGMEVHEEPRLSQMSKTVLKPGMIVTVEPGIYLAGVGGTRIEDDTLITADGNRSFTHSTKELLSVGD